MIDFSRIVVYVHTFLSKSFFFCITLASSANFACLALSRAGLRKRKRDRERRRETERKRQRERERVKKWLRARVRDCGKCQEKKRNDSRGRETKQSCGVESRQQLERQKIAEEIEDMNDWNKGDNNIERKLEKARENKRGREHCLNFAVKKEGRKKEKRERQREGERKREWEREREREKEIEDRKSVV